MNTYAISLGIIQFKDKYLIAKRADSKRFAAGQWEFISGFIDSNGTAEEIILKELKEELNVVGEITMSGDPYLLVDNEARWIIIPFLIKVKNGFVEINPADHSEIKWVSSNELNNYPDLPNISKLRSIGFF